MTGVIRIDLPLLEAAQPGSEFSAGLDRSALEHDHLRQCALARAVEVVGEATTKAPDEHQANNPQIAWAKLKGMRIRLARACFDINLDVFWRTVTFALPLLVKRLQALVNEIADV